MERISGYTSENVTRSEYTLRRSGFKLEIGVRDVEFSLEYNDNGEIQFCDEKPGEWKWFTWYGREIRD